MISDYIDYNYNLPIGRFSSELNSEEILIHDFIFDFENKRLLVGVETTKEKEFHYNEFSFTEKLNLTEMSKVINLALKDRIRLISNRKKTQK